MHIFWTIIAVAAAGVVCVWVLFQFNLLPISTELWMDMYTGNLRLRKTCAGIIIKTELHGNFSSGFAPGGNLATYKDPEGREDWVRVGDGALSRPYEIDPASVVLSDAESLPYLSLLLVARAITDDPRPGYKYAPPNGYSKQAKKYLLLNCLQIARETRDAELINQYYDYTVETLRPLDRKAYPDDLPDVEEFIASHSQ